MKTFRKYLAFIVVLFLLFSCKKSTEPVIPGWEVLSIGSNVELTKVDFVDSHYGWVIGNDTVVYHTTDGGNSWVRQSYPQYQGLPTGLHDIHFIDRQHGWAVGDFRLIYKTTDGGQNWVIAETVSFEAGALRCVIFTDPLHGWICASSSISYLRTTDGGETWNPVYSNPYQIILWDFVDSLNGWARITGAINKTSDGGITWTNIYPGPIASGFFDFVDLNNGWGLQLEQVSEYEMWYWIIHTTDGGYNWKLQLDTFKYQIGSSALLALEMLNPTTGWISKWESKVASVLHTTNGGNRWVEQPLPPIGDRFIVDFDFINEREGWAVGNNGFPSSGVILRTKSGGNPIR